MSSSSSSFSSSTEPTPSPRLIQGVQMLLTLSQPVRMSWRIQASSIEPMPYEIKRPSTIKPMSESEESSSSEQCSDEESEESSAESEDSVDITKEFQTLEPEEYAVERIIKARNRRDGVREYLVKWEGYSSHHNSWITRDLFTLPDMPDAYEALEIRTNRRRVTNPRRVSGRKRSAC